MKKNLLMLFMLCSSMVRAHASTKSEIDSNLAEGKILQVSSAAHYSHEHESNDLIQKFTQNIKEQNKIVLLTNEDKNKVSDFLKELHKNTEKYFHEKEKKCILELFNDVYQKI